MLQFKRLLAIVDYRHQEHMALPRALELAHQYGAELTILGCTYDDLVRSAPFIHQQDLEAIRENEVRQCRQKLEEALAKFDTNGGIVNIEVIWRKNFHQGVVEYINNNEFDLVVKNARTHSAIQRIFLTPTDWHLIRESNTSILFVKQAHWPINSCILGAINVQAEDELHHQLNRKILAATQSLAKQHQVPPHMINVFPWPLLDKHKLKHLFDKKGFYDDKKARHLKRFKEYTAEFEWQEEQVHIVEGLHPEDVIPTIVKTIGAEMLVLGSASRQGVSAAVIGNTAEKILDDIYCDVLTLK